MLRFFGMIAALMFLSTCVAFAQDKLRVTRPDTEVSGVRLADRASAKAFIGGFQPRFGEDGRPVYYFYNRLGDQVLKMTAASFEDRYFLTELEVYRVGKSYTAAHFQTDKIGIFKTDNDIFTGYKESLTASIIGVPNLDGKARAGVKTVIKKLGDPQERKVEGDSEILIYNRETVDFPDEKSPGAKLSFGYDARYEFREGKLKKFWFRITPRS